MYDRIVVALDGSALAEAVLPHVAALAEPFRPTVTLVRAYEPPASLMAGVAASALPGTGPLFDPGPAIQAGREEADAYLDGIAARLAAAGLCTEPIRVDGPPAASILAVARRRHASLIAMTTHGRGGLNRLVFGSVAEAVLRAAPCPVLLVRVDERHEGTTVEAGSEVDHHVAREGDDRASADESRVRGDHHPARAAAPVAGLPWATASVAHPCPVCGATGGCCVVQDTGYARCRNVPASHPIGGGGWLHEIRSAGALTHLPRAGSSPARREPRPSSGVTPGR
jgi:nucleotide-binding universal stress UspA family protein